MVEILQGPETYLTVRLLRFREDISQQDPENIESIVVCTRFQTMDERNASGRTATVREPGRRADFDDVCETQQGRASGRN